LAEKVLGLAQKFLRLVQKVLVLVQKVLGEFLEQPGADQLHWQPQLNLVEVEFEQLVS